MSIYFFSWNINQYNISVRRSLNWKMTKMKNKTKVRYFLYIWGGKNQNIYAYRKAMSITWDLWELSRRQFQKWNYRNNNHSWLTGTSPLFEVELVFLLKICLRKTLLLCYIVSSYMKLEYDHVTVRRDSLTVSLL